MKEKHVNGGGMMYANYVVPVYNFGGDVRHLDAYTSGAMYVDVWGVKAALGDEYNSMHQSIQNAEMKYQTVLENAPYDINIKRNMAELKNLRECFTNPKYYNVIDNNLKLIVAKRLREQQLKTDLDQAKYLFGFSMFDCFKEALR